MNLCSKSQSTTNYYQSNKSEDLPHEEERLHGVSQFLLSLLAAGKRFPLVSVKKRNSMDMWPFTTGTLEKHHNGNCVYLHFFRVIIQAKPIVFKL